MNPALPAGAGLSLDVASRAEAWSGYAQLTAGWLSFPSRVIDNRPEDDPDRARLDLGLSTLVAGFGRGLGPEVEVQLPVGFIARTSVAESGIDTGLGDLELRGRWSARALDRLRVAAGLGVAAPTGAYAARSGLVGFLENARYLTLGRGVFWALGDVDARLSLPAMLGVQVQATVRVPLNEARDGWRWGSEVRTAAGLTLGPVAERLTLAATAEAQWRAQSSEIDPFLDSRVVSENTGGWWFTALLSAQVRVVPGLSVFVAGRLPLGQVVSGYQFIPGVGVFAGVAGSLELIPPPRVAARPVASRLTLVEYGASWCEPCKKLGPLLDEFEKRRPDVVVTRVDASDWSADELERALPGVPGLPVVEVFGADGARVERLTGARVFEFESVVPSQTR